MAHYPDSDGAGAGRLSRGGGGRLLGILTVVAIVLILLFVVANPVIRLFLSSISDPQTGMPTLENYAAAFGSMRGLKALANTVVYGLAVTGLAVVLALPMAWAVSRSDMPCKSLVKALVLGAFITPSYLGAVGWILLAGPNAGWLNRIWVALTGAETPLFDIFSFGGLIFVTAIYAFPYVFVFVSDALELVSSEMEDAAGILGAGLWRTTRLITLPLVLPAICAGAIITFLDTVALFGTPAIIALPARVNVMTLQLWQFFEYPVRIEAAAAYSIPLILVTCLLFAVQRIMLGRKGYVALTGKAGSRRPTECGAMRWVLLGYCLTVCSLAVVLPYLSLAQAAFSEAWGRGLSWDNATLENFRYILFDHQGSARAIVNTFLYSAAAATAAVGLGLAVAYLISRRIVPFGSVLGLITMAPFAIPGVVLAIGFYVTYTAPPFALYGTALILIVAYTARFLPVAFASASAAIRSLNPELEEAARILGASRMLTVVKVVAPLLKYSLAGSWVLVFIPAMRELSTALFLVTPDTRVLSIMLLDLSENGNFEAMSALGVVLLLSTIIIVLVSRGVLGRDVFARKA